MIEEKFCRINYQKKKGKYNVALINSYREIKLIEW